MRQVELKCCLIFLLHLMVHQNRRGNFNQVLEEHFKLLIASADLWLKGLVDTVIYRSCFQVVRATAQQYTERNNFEEVKLVVSRCVPFCLWRKKN